MSGPTVRRAELGDADAMGRVHVAAWQAAYRGHMPDDLLDGLDPAERAARWRDQIVRDDVTSLVIEDGTSTVVGIAAVGADRGETGAAGELWLINLAPEAWGRGLGRRLLEAATDELRGQGFDEAVLWVLDANARARRLYERAGWSPDGGAKAEDMGGTTVREVRYRRRLSPPPPAGGR